MNHEEIAIANLRANAGELPLKGIDFFGEIFGQIRATEKKISESSPDEVCESMWAFLGLMTRYQLMICCIDQLAARNFNGFYAAFRALVESLCAIVWASENTDRLPALVQQSPISIGKIMNAGYRKYPDLRRIYSAVSGIVHPSRNGHGLVPRKRSQDNSVTGLFTPFELEFSGWFANTKLRLLLDISARIVDEFEGFVSAHPEALRKGRLMASGRLRQDQKNADSSEGKT